MAQMRRTYSKEFKREALALLANSGKSRHALEQELGLSHGLLKDWKRQAERDGEQAFPGHGNLKADEVEFQASADAAYRQTRVYRQSPLGWTRTSSV